jgi:hypothetical protein
VAAGLGIGDAARHPYCVVRRADREVTIAFTDWAQEEKAS